MYYYDYQEFRDDTLALAQQCRSFEPDTILGIARGGLMLSQILAYALKIRNLQSIRVESYDEQHKRDTLNLHVDCDLNGCERVLVVDDIVDSGDTLKQVLSSLQTLYPDITFKSASLFYKPTASIQSDYKLKEATEWIEFFWEKDFVLPNSIISDAFREDSEDLRAFDERKNEKSISFESLLKQLETDGKL